MVKTQIQVPEELFRDVKSFAKAREWSLAETFRRGAELLLEVYDGSPQDSAWSPPVSTKVGWQGLSPAQLKELALRDADPSPAAP